MPGPGAPPNAPPNAPPTATPPVPAGNTAPASSGVQQESHSPEYSSRPTVPPGQSMFNNKSLYFNLQKPIV
jgi:hypothetical protein